MDRNLARARDRVRHVLTGLAAYVLRIGILAGLAMVPSLPAQAVPGGSPIVVRDDRGGLLGVRSDLIRQYRSAGQRVELRGTCLSACTMYLALPDICVASGARFGFHGPSDHGRRLSDAEFEHWSQLMARHYNAPLQAWYLAEARYRISGYYELTGAELIRLGYPSC